MESTTYTAFCGIRHLVTADLAGMLTAVKAHMDSRDPAPVLIFEDDTGSQIDFDFRGTEDEILARARPEQPRHGPGRPRLGVVCGEVSLLPRHWEWLERQQHNISATIRRLVDEAIKREPDAAKARFAIEAADRELWVLAGNMQGCEEASRALYARDFGRFDSLAAAWPADVARHLCAMAAKGRVPA
jgi:uncharacterized protein